MNLTVIGPRVFIRPDKLPEMTADGLLHIIHDRQQSTMTGTVVAVGDGPEQAKRAANAAFDCIEGSIMFGASRAALDKARASFNSEHSVAVGERVLFSPASGEELIFEKDVLIAMAEDDILAVVE